MKLKPFINFLKKGLSYKKFVYDMKYYLIKVGNFYLADYEVRYLWVSWNNRFVHETHEHQGQWDMQNCEECKWKICVFHIGVHLSTCFLWSQFI